MNSLFFWPCAFLYDDTRAQNKLNTVKITPPFLNCRCFPLAVVISRAAYSPGEEHERPHLRVLITYVQYDHWRREVWCGISSDVAVSQKQQHLRLFLMDPVQLSRHYYYHCLAQASRRALSHSSTRVLHQQRNKLSSIQRWWQSLAADGTLLAAAVVRVGRIVQGGDHGHRPRRTTFLPCFPFPCSRTRKVAIFSFL
jgi:hypothetical protein